MKSILAASVVLALSLSGCGNNGKDNDKDKKCGPFHDNQTDASMTITGISTECCSDFRTGGPSMKNLTHCDGQTAQFITAFNGYGCGGNRCYDPWDKMMLIWDVSQE